MKSDTRCKEMISNYWIILTLFLQEMFDSQEMFGQIVRLWKVATPHGRASQHLSSGAAPKCTDVFLWCLGKKLQICWKFRENLNKAKSLVFSYKNQTYLTLTYFFVLRTWIIVNSTSRIVPTCRVVNLAKSSAIRHMCSLQLGRIGALGRNVLSLEMDWSAGQLLAPSCRAFSVGRI